MGRPRLAEETAVVSIRLPIDLVRRLDRYADELRAVTPGVNITRTDAARAILTRALTASQPHRPARRKTPAKA
jgi:predicted transcriptional regulator